MLLVMTLTMLLTPFLSPLKLAFSVTSMSVALSMTLYSASSSVFPACGVVISFSSGMMILFCYCAMMSNYESKTSNATKWAAVVVGAVGWSMWETSESMTPSKEILTSMGSPLLVAAMMVIITTMVCINKSMFTPTKSLVGSY